MESPFGAEVRLTAAGNCILLSSAVTHRGDLAGRRGDTEPPQSRERFDAAAASADAGYCSLRFFLERILLTISTSVGAVSFRCVVDAERS